ncbi:hypothetical protein GQ457_05G018930 [Hibiscus cannabinus]
MSEIIHETSAPYFPQQNGIAERKNKTLKEMMNSLLISYRFNPIRTMERLSPNLQYLKVWGCLAKVGLPDFKKSTIGPKTVDAMFIEYATNNVAYSFHSQIAIHQVDVKTAFLNKDLDKDIYMDQPLGFETPGSKGKHARDDDMMIDFTSHALCCLVLPPDREVEFVIETQTDSAPVSIPPYRRSPKELKELKTQLQELLDRGFIRLSTSTWGTPIDLRFGYYQLKVREQDVLRTAFRTSGCFLTKRLRKCVRFEWSDARQQAFEKLKEALTNAPVLIQPVSEKELYMRQRRWLELLKDYDLSIEYHPASIQRAPVRWAETRQKLSPLVDILKVTTEKVKLRCDRLKTASDRQKSYVDLKRREIEYVVGDRVFLKVSPWKKVMRFGRKGKLSPRYIGPYEIVERVGSVTYRLLLPIELERIHDVFHVSMLQRILASDSKVLRGRTIELVKVKWRHRGVEEATWERKEDMMEQFPYLFPSGNFEDEISLSGGEL